MTWHELGAFIIYQNVKKTNRIYVGEHVQRAIKILSELMRREVMQHNRKWIRYMHCNNADVPFLIKQIN